MIHSTDLFHIDIIDAGEGPWFAMALVEINGETMQLTFSPRQGAMTDTSNPVTHFESVADAVSHLAQHLTEFVLPERIPCHGAFVIRARDRQAALDSFRTATGSDGVQEHAQS